MVLDKLPGPNIFTQRDVRETPKSTATATSLSVVDATYLTLSNNTDLTDERVLTAGEGIDFNDAGANNTLTINGEDSTLLNKGICSFTAGTGINITITAGDVDISSNDSAIVHDNLSGFVANEHLDWTADQGATNIHSGNYTDTDTTDHTSFSNIGTNTHAQIDTHLALTNEHLDWTADQGATNIHSGNYTDTDTTDHTALSNIGTNTHAQIDTHIAGDGSDHSLLANKTSYWTSSASNFKVKDNNGAYTSSWLGEQFTSNAIEVAANTIMYCPVELPHNAIVTGAIIYGAATSGTSATWTLYQQVNDAGAPDSMANANVASEDTSITNATIDNSTSFYYFKITAGNGDENRFYGARITYTTDYD